jgi:hypothetical protein
MHFHLDFDSLVSSLNHAVTVRRGGRKVEDYDCAVGS